jgi:hypothetical protein
MAEGWRIKGQEQVRLVTCPSSPSAANSGHILLSPNSTIRALGTIGAGPSGFFRKNTTQQITPKFHA